MFQDFHKDVADPHFYDLIVNREHLDVEEAPGLIARQWLRKSPQQ